MQRLTQGLILTMLIVLCAGACKPQAQAQAAAAPAASADAAAPAAAPTAPAAPVKYRVELTPLWTKANFPFEYPDTSLIHKPHFSGLIGTAHNVSYHIFAEGTLPTPGLERLS